MKKLLLLVVLFYSVYAYSQGNAKYSKVFIVAGNLNSSFYSKIFFNDVLVAELIPEEDMLKFEYKIFSEGNLIIRAEGWVNDPNNIAMVSTLSISVINGNSYYITLNQKDYVVDKSEEVEEEEEEVDGQSMAYTKQFVLTKIDNSYGNVIYNKKRDGLILEENKNSPLISNDININNTSSEEYNYVNVDENIPINQTKKKYRFALIIGNEDYSSYQKGLSSESNVIFAMNDAEVFSKYCTNTLGIEKSNIFLIKNATFAQMNQEIERVTKLLTSLGNYGELIFYYAGHGFPDEITKEPYLIPVDVSSSNLNSAIKLYDITKKFSQTKAKRISVFLDACFTGNGRVLGLVSDRGIKVKPKQQFLGENIIVFTATSELQTALPFKKTQHGMFTYFLLKELQETSGNITYKQLFNKLLLNVTLFSLVLNKQEQAPNVIVNSNLKDSWYNWTFK